MSNKYLFSKLLIKQIKELAQPMPARMIVFDSKFVWQISRKLFQCTFDHLIKKKIIEVVVEKSSLLETKIFL